MLADFARVIKQQQVYKATVNGEFAGYVVYSYKDEGVFLENMAVLPEYSRKGIGSALLAHVEHQAAEAGLDTVRLYTNSAMSENLSWYSACGYIETGRRVQDGFSRVFFEKRL